MYREFVFPCEHDCRVDCFVADMTTVVDIVAGERRNRHILARRRIKL